MANEIDRLDPIPEMINLRSGLRVRLEPLKARQFFALLRIITHGALPSVQAGLLNMDDLDTDEFMGRLLSITLLSIPDAEDETIGFVRSLCYPDGLIERSNLNKQDLERNQILWDGLDAELENPDLDDLVTILEAVVKRESGDIQALGKRLASMFKLAQKTGQIPTPTPSPNPTASTSASSADSPARSTSSQPPTAGTTRKSATSRSAASGNASRRSAKTSTTSAGSVNIG